MTECPDCGETNARVHGFACQHKGCPMATEVEAAQSLHDLEGAYRSVCIHNERLRAALLPCVGWLEYAYGNVDSVTATAVKAHLPAIRAAISQDKRGNET